MESMRENVLLMKITKNRESVRECDASSVKKEKCAITLRGQAVLIFTIIEKIRVRRRSNADGSAKLYRKS